MQAVPATRQRCGGARVLALCCPGAAPKRGFHGFPSMPHGRMAPEAYFPHTPTHSFPSQTNPNLHALPPPFSFAAGPGGLLGLLVRALPHDAARAAAAGARAPRPPGGGQGGAGRWLPADLVLSCRRHRAAHAPCAFHKACRGLPCAPGGVPSTDPPAARPAPAFPKRHSGGLRADGGQPGASRRQRHPRLPHLPLVQVTNSSFHLVMILHCIHLSGL